MADEINAPQGETAAEGAAPTADAMADTEKMKALEAERDAMCMDRDKMKAERDEMAKELDAMKAEMESLKGAAAKVDEMSAALTEAKARGDAMRLHFDLMKGGVAEPYLDFMASDFRAKGADATLEDYLKATRTTQPAFFSDFQAKPADKMEEAPTDVAPLKGSPNRTSPTPAAGSAPTKLSLEDRLAALDPKSEDFMAQYTALRDEMLA